MFGEITDKGMVLNEYGGIVESCLNAIPVHFKYVDIDETIIMPNHVHMILTINRTGVACNAPTQNGNYYSRIAPKHNTLAVIIRSFKSAVTKQINIIRNNPGMPVWHRNYYEHVIRNEKELYVVRKYIQDNPVNWDKDDDNPKNN